MKTTKKKLLLFPIILTLLASTVLSLFHVTSVNAASKPHLNSTKVTLTVGKTKQLKLSGTTKRVTWSSSNRRVATVSSRGKVSAKKSGTATITAKSNGRKYNCKVTVKSISKTHSTKTHTTVDKYVWITATGKCYHRTNHCGNTNPSRARKVKLSEAKKHYRACKKCF